MRYLKDFRTKLTEHDYPACVRLWEEYCFSDEIDPEELRLILLSFKDSEFAHLFGKYVEKILPLWALLPQSSSKHDLFKLIIDLETTDQDTLRQSVLEYLNERYGEVEGFAEKIRFMGLRSKETFQGAISHFELLNHLKKHNFVLHTGGWGVGEIVDISMNREQIGVEFELTSGRKDISFDNAFATLIPVTRDHFLALRFGDPERMEELVRTNPLEVIHSLLRDLGPKTAAEIKEELCDVVLPAKDWSRWWQNLRLKMKKDTLIGIPKTLKDPFSLRVHAVSHAERLRTLLEESTTTDELIRIMYPFIRDFFEEIKALDGAALLQEKIEEELRRSDLTEGQKLQLCFFLEDVSAGKGSFAVQDLVLASEDVESLVHSVSIVAYKRRILAIILKKFPNWQKIFFNLLFTIEQNSLRDYLFSELFRMEDPQELKSKIAQLWARPLDYPEAFVWYFQKVVADNEIPYADQEGRNRFFEAFFVLLSQIEHSVERRDLAKKMQAILTNRRYEVVRNIMQGADRSTVEEFLLLASKCYALAGHDMKILYSLAGVVHPSIEQKKQTQDLLIWTTEMGFNKLKDRIQQIATVETVQNAKEIEVARSHGDLRENAEFKAALEKRDRLQSELRVLSDQFNRARILTQSDIHTDEVGIGCVVKCKNSQGKEKAFTLLGPWDAEPSEGILSFQSKLAQDMKGLFVGQTFRWQEDEYTIVSIRSYLG